MVCCCHLSCMLRGMNTLFTCFTGFNFRLLHWITEETNTAHLFHSDSENLSSLLFKAWRNVQQLFKDRKKVSSSQFAPAACFKATFTLRPSQIHKASLGMQTERSFTLSRTSADNRKQEEKTSFWTLHFVVLVHAVDVSGHPTHGEHYGIGLSLPLRQVCMKCIMSWRWTGL